MISMRIKSRQFVNGRSYAKATMLKFSLVNWLSTVRSALTMLILPPMLCIRTQHGQPHAHLIEGVRTKFHRVGKPTVTWSTRATKQRPSTASSSWKLENPSGNWISLAAIRGNLMLSIGGPSKRPKESINSGLKRRRINVETLRSKEPKSLSSCYKDVMTSRPLATLHSISQ